MHSRAPVRVRPRLPLPGRRAVGGLFVFTAGVHVGLVGADPQVYRGFADAALVPVVQRAWDEVFLAHPAWWGLVLAAFELGLGLLLLLGGRRARQVGWIGVLGFHVALMAFGWGFWLWTVPFLALVAPAARADLVDSP